MLQAKTVRFLNNLAAYRTRAGLTQEKAAVDLGFPRSRLSLWEGGRELPAWDVARKFMAFYQVTLEELYPSLEARNLIARPE